MHDDAAIRAACDSILAAPPTAAGLGGHFQRLAARNPDQTAIVFRDTRRTFADVDRTSSRLARALARHGVGVQSRAVICLPNRPEFIELALAVLKLGGTVVPISHRLPDIERDELLGLADAVVVVAEAHATVPGALALDRLLSEAAGESADPHPDVPTLPWKAVPSGGSTGRSKLIVDHTGGPMADGLHQIFGMRPGGMEIVAGPLYHNGPFGWGMLQLFAGGGIVLMDHFDADEYLRTIQTERINWSFVVPTMLHRVMRLPAATRAAYDISSLEVLLLSAAPTPAWLKRDAIEFFGAERVWEFYGAAEVAATMIRGDDWLRHAGSVGRPLPYFTLHIRDEEGRPLPAGVDGEIWVESPIGPTFSYVGGDARIADGLVSVGDLGHLDGEGYLYIADRRADLILSGGANVYPAEVEGALLRHPDVIDVAVVGLADQEWGQRVHAIVQLRPNADVPDEVLDAHARAHLAPYKVPRSYEVVAQLPRDPSGKLRRSALRAERSTPADAGLQAPSGGGVAVAEGT